MGNAHEVSWSERVLTRRGRCGQRPHIAQILDRHHSPDTGKFRYGLNLYLIQLAHHTALYELSHPCGIKSLQISHHPILMAWIDLDPDDLHFRVFHQPASAATSHCSTHSGSFPAVHKMFPYDSLRLASLPDTGAIMRWSWSNPSGKCRSKTGLIASHRRVFLTCSR